MLKKCKKKYAIFSFILMLNMLQPSQCVAADIGLTLVQESLGNIFLATETVKIQILSNGTNVEWMVKDFWDNTVATGTNEVIDGKVFITPELEQSVGYFSMNITANGNGMMSKSAETSFAVVYDNDNVDKNLSPFGVVTHFSQSWDTDIMPLISKAGIKRVRDENYWSTVEKQKGVYDFSRYQGYMDDAEQSGLDVLMPLTFGNTLYDNHNN